MEKAYYNLISSRHKDYITKITPETGKNLLKVMVYMGVRTDGEKPFLPLIGQVNLLYSPPTKGVNVDKIIKEFENANDV